MKLWRERERGGEKGGLKLEKMGSGASGAEAFQPLRYSLRISGLSLSGSTVINNGWILGRPFVLSVVRKKIINM